ncbi:MAG: HlyD family efflux transporter periplasmic adaptor subunit [Limimaricola sp.]|uniref:efflux RND transporter periplasmic adaptor subunit n=1 Tax=Limimaricola sp. TaxID=2211665 RepID=UPI001DBF2F67|nr:efflux RND transporter periplasmic adaptor subunit [Limimaricola sp.]MBI1417659.1 HlyD family efflux transporter periplasmic adaptor subunit [Limimaricola sp.]
MTGQTAYRTLRAALMQHLAAIDGLLACQAFVRPEGGDWAEAASVGQGDPNNIAPVLQAFDPEARGSVTAIQGPGGAAWLATYACAGPGLDMCLLFYLSGITPSDLQSRLYAIEDKTGWLLVSALRDADETRADVTLSIEMGAAVLLDAAQARTRGDLADQWIARLERALAPDLVGVAWVSNDAPKLAALSGGGLIERQSRARRALEDLAAEAIEARSNQSYDPSGTGEDETQTPLDDTVSDALSALEAAKALAMPLYVGDPCRAVVVALWTSPEAVLPQPASVDLIAQVLGESLAIQERARPSIWRRLRNWAGGTVRLIFGKRAGKIKIGAALVALALVVMSITPTQSRPAFEARIEARDRFIVSAPFDGFLSQAPFQLGDAVPKGALVVAMEDTDFRLQYARAQAEARRLETEIQAARSARDSAKVRSLDAQAQQTQVQIDLLDQQLKQAKLTAQNAGVVVGGDAWRRVGGRVRLGEPLLEIADPQSFAVMAFIDESWVAEIPPGAHASLLLAAYPQTPLPLTLNTVTTDAQTRGGVNTFSAWLKLDAAPPAELLEGMRGIVRIDTGPTTLLAEYSRGVVRWLRQTVWKWS